MTGNRVGRAVRDAPPWDLARSGTALLVLALAMGWGCARGGPGPSPGPEPGEGPAPAEAEPEGRPEPTLPDRYYWAYVASDRADVVSRLRFGPGGVVYEKAIPVGSVPDRPDGVGELALSPDGSHWFVALAGGATSGSVRRYETGTDRMAGRAEFRGSPGSLAVTPDGAHVFTTVAPPGGSGTATVAVLRDGGLTEAARMATCRDGRASRVHPDGRWQYSVCRADDVVVEVSVPALRVSRTARLGGDGRCGPVDLALSPDGDRVYVPCGASAELVVLDREEMASRHRLSLGAPPVDVEVSRPDGRVLVLLDEPPSLLVLEEEAEDLSARIPLSAPRPSAVAVSDDGRYAFVTLRGREGAPRSVVEILDLRALARVATVEVPEGAASAMFWRSRSGG